MTLQTLAKLIKSLSGPEKRYFKLHTRMQSGSKDYLFLFDIIDKSPSVDLADIKEKFKEEHSTSSLNNTARYLVKVLTDTLIQSKSEKDNFFQLLQEIMRVKILQERSLGEDGYGLLKKIRKAAHDSQQHLIEYFTYREELNYLSDTSFHEINDTALIETQMKAKEILKILNHIQDHHSLFELLKYRLIHSGKISSDEEKKRLNDLMLSEMILVAGKSKNSFAAQKLHLLFQSFFFTNIGDYQSALNIFRSLNKLFEDNLHMLDKPPLDYLSTLNGILDSLHSLKKFEEIKYYISKVSLLDQPVYPEYFRYQVKKTAAVYQFTILAGDNKYQEAIDYINESDPAILKMYNMVNEEKQWELYFYYSLVYFKNKDLKKAHYYIREIMCDHKIQPQLFICKAIRLLDIMLHHQKGDTDYIEYEIRSYKRFFREHHALGSEKLLLKYISSWPDERRKRIPEAEEKKIRKDIDAIRHDKYEMQLLKYFDFSGWILERIGH